MTDVFKQATKAFALFATACERMNQLAVELGDDSRFGDVRTGQDIRHYESGWRLEKWVEALIDADEGLWACWWLELGCTDDNWLVGTSASISHSDIDLDLPDRSAAGISELEVVLDEGVGALIALSADSSKFGKEIAKLRNHG